MPKKTLIAILSILVIIFVSTTIYFATNSNKVTQTKYTKNTNGTDNENKITLAQKPEGWSTYTNEEYNFSLHHPPNTVIDTSSADELNPLYIRLQNYPLDAERRELLGGEYYLEIWVHNKKSKYREDRSCKNPDSRQVNLGRTTGWRNFETDAIESGGYVSALCAETEDKTFLFRATDSSKMSELTSQILDTVKF